MVFATQPLSLMSLLYRLRQAGPVLSMMALYGVQYLALVIDHIQRETLL